MRLSFSPAALRQVQEIYRFIAADNPDAAQRVLDRIYVVAEHIAQFPDSGRITSIARTRVIPAHPFPYLVYFRRVPGSEEVRVVRVRHAARRPVGLNDESREFAAQ